MAVQLLPPPAPPAASAPPAPVTVPATCADQQGADGANGLAGDLSPSIIDMDIFTQLLEMDDEDDREFSKSIVWNYFDQAETTFDEMDAALSSQNLGELSKLTITLRDVKVQYKEAAKALKAFYDEEDEQGDTHDDAQAQPEPASVDEPTQQKVDPVTEEKAESSPAQVAAKASKAEDSS
jgi:osomolarity two-component system phosphorelay intermediate protein YPD1